MRKDHIAHAAESRSLAKGRQTERTAEIGIISARIIPRPGRGAAQLREARLLIAGENLQRRLRVPGERR
jgi:hypothetical protein